MKKIGIILLIISCLMQSFPLCVIGEEVSNTEESTSIVETIDQANSAVASGSFSLDALNPLEVKAGMDPIKLKREYGDKLVLHGGVNAVLWDDRDAIISEIDRVIPVLKENGGYIFSSDHSIPNSVSLANFRAIVDEIKRVGRY